MTPRILLLALATVLAISAGCESRSSARLETQSPSQMQSSTAQSPPSSQTEPPASQTESPASQTVAAAKSYDSEMSTVCQAGCAVRVPYQEADVVPQPGAKTGNFTRCVVSGVVFVVAEGRPEVGHAGNSYYLCCDGCANKFREDPGRFTGS